MIRRVQLIFRLIERTRKGPSAVVLEKESISHESSEREGQHNWREVCGPGIQHALACADRTAQFIASFDVPHSLKDVGVSRNEIQQIVLAVLHEVKERAVVDKPITEAEVVALLEASH
jgi:alcohol dehydrogenase class IV